MNSEEKYIEMEAARIDSSEQYFSARPQIDTNDRRKVFESGFDRGWQAALSAKSVPVARSLDFEAMHTPFGIHATPQHANKVLERGMTLRDWFAGRVCAAMMTATSADTGFPDPDYRHPDYRLNSEGQTVAERIACISYQMADAMLKARGE